MGKIVLNFQISLDGIVSDPDKWANIDDILMQDSIDRYDRLDASIFGSETYSGMAEYWQNAEETSENPLERELAKKLNEKKKYVISHSDVEIVWRNSELVKISDIDSLSAKLESIKNSAEKDIAVESGIGLWRAFIQNSLFDEIYMMVHPIIAAKGTKLFTGDETKMDLSLESSRSFSNGVINLNYAKKN